jgi:hypothetical protein
VSPSRNAGISKSTDLEIDVSKRKVDERDRINFFMIGIS